MYPTIRMPRNTSISISPKPPQRLELHRPGKKENRFHIEDDEQDGDDVVADGVTSARVVIGIDAALVGHELGAIRTLRANDARHRQRDRNQNSDDSDEEKGGNVVLRHLSSSNRLCRQAGIVPLNGARFKDKRHRVRLLALSRQALGNSLAIPKQILPDRVHEVRTNIFFCHGTLTGSFTGFWYSVALVT